MNDGRSAFEWGLASVLVGGITLCGGMQSYYGPPIVPNIPILEDVSGIGTVVLVIPALVQAIAFAGTAFGVRAILLARRSHRPAALGLAGLFLGVAALLNWTIVGVVWYGDVITPTMQMPFGPTPSFGAF